MDNNLVQPEASKEQESQKPAGEQAIKIKINRKTAIIIAVVVILGALAYVSRGFFIAALVDGSPISRWSVISRLEKSSGKNLLNSLITQKLIQNEAKAKNIIISNDEVNKEIEKIKEEIATQGGTIDEALASQGMSLEDLKLQIVLQKDLEKLLGDKAAVTDQEIAQYISENKIVLPVGQEATTTEQVKNELKNQKVNQGADALIAELKSKAKINYFVNY